MNQKIQKLLDSNPQLREFIEVDKEYKKNKDLYRAWLSDKNNQEAHKAYEDHKKYYLKIRSAYTKKYGN